ncbi:zinc-dependent alcohol dehydrogenase [Halochromatium glycolicum]|uniref:Dehydrogenase n=1 Tax=Halochromatium glycolicum TaxID=85075 RepID=A0AAJ0U422_9GAMM|nr:zinc-binding alcohol dehydrogenase [Halochromatium glycolicum]MBK1704837.1 dehydrogenase [Halochromatium glycolicum]
MTKPLRARAYWLVEPGRGELREEVLPELERGEVQVRTLYSGISRGTETLVFRGEVPPSEWQRMRAPFQAGEFPAPVKYGYSSVGRIEASGEEASGEGDTGRLVFCLFPHQSCYRLPATAVHPIPESVPAARAVLAAQMETAVNGLWDAQPRIGDRIAIVGAGTLGCLCAWLAARIPGCEVELIDTNRRRAEIAAAFGVAYAAPEQARPEADLVIHTSGSGSGATTALALAGFEARIVELSWFGARRVELPLGGEFHARRLTLRSSQVGNLPLEQRGRWDHPRRLRLALSLLDDPVLDQLITGEDAFEDLPRVMATLASAPSDTLMHRIRYDSDA